jgi:hypothetical protein
MNRDNNYPNISDILARKAEGRVELAARSFTQKIELLEEMNARVEPIRRARIARIARLSVSEDQA